MCVSVRLDFLFFFLDSVLVGPKGPWVLRFDRVLGLHLRPLVSLLGLVLEILVGARRYLFAQNDMKTKKEKGSAVHSELRYQKRIPRQIAIYLQAMSFTSKILGLLCMLTFVVT